MKVKILEEGGIKHAGLAFTYEDEVTVADDVGANWCANGWAEDLDGKIETGERTLQNNVTLVVDDGASEHAAEDVG